MTVHGAGDARDSALPMRAAIVDDEPLARARLVRLLGTHRDVSVVGEHENGRALVAAHREAPLDLVLLDVQMPELDGLAAVARLDVPRPAVVFVTAHARHAVDAFGIDAVDYLLKPVDAERLADALQRVRRHRRGIQPPAAASPPRRLALQLGRRSDLVQIDAIDLVTAHENYVEFRVGAREYVLRRTLAWAEEQLDARAFLRIHRSRIVRVAAVRSVRSLASGRYVLTLHDGFEVQSGRSQRDRVRSVFGLD
jgi:two-component system LytT family response regulator